MITHDAKFQVLNSEGLGYDRNSWVMTGENDFAITFKVMPKRAKVVTLVFPVPKESLSQA